MADLCCICEADVSQGTLKKKRKSLFGFAGKDTLKLMNDVCLEKFRRQLPANEPSYVCHKCHYRVTNIPVLVKKVVSEKKFLLDSVKKLVTGTTSRKRPALDQDTGVRSEDTEETSRIEGCGLATRDYEETTEAAVCDIELDDTRREAFELPGGGGGTSRDGSEVDMSDKEIQGDGDGETLQPTPGSNELSVQIKYPSGMRTFVVNTPWRQKQIKKAVRRSFRSYASDIMSSPRTNIEVLCQLSRSIRRELKSVSSTNYDSILRDTLQGILEFSWDSVFAELLLKVPTLTKLLVSLFNDGTRSKMIICMIICMILKRRARKMALLQGILSVVLYGNGCTKQIFNCLQPLMISFSYTGTMKLVDRLSNDYDVPVQLWSHELTETLKSQRDTQLTSHITVQAGDQDNGESEVEDGICYEEWTDHEMADDVDEYEEVVRNIDNDDNDMTEGEIAQALNQLESNVAIMESDKRGSVLGAWTGFKIVGDNLDKNYRRTFQRIDYQTISHHYFHSFVALDRVDLSGASDDQGLGVIDIKSLLPSKEDVSELKTVMAVLVSRILVKHMKEFIGEADTVVWHIPHKYSSEMNKKSTIVPLGIDLLNENKLDEMCLIMDRLHNYVPTIVKNDPIQLPNGDVMEIKETCMWETLFGGDQLTVARARGAAMIRASHSTTKDQLRGLVPVLEDWHSRMTLMKVIWNRLFSTKTVADKGTLYQLKNLIHRTSVPLDPKSNMQAAEDFLETVVDAHIIVAAETLMKTNTCMTATSLAKEIVDRFVHLAPVKSMRKDQVFTYSCEVITLGLVWLNYYDSVKEGDGERVMKLWKFLLVLFKQSGRTNYSKEAAILLIQFHFLASDRVSKQIMTSRFINTKGRVGCNLPCDLHLEHLNRRLKSVIRHCGSNIQPKTLIRASKAIGIVDDVCTKFSDEILAAKPSDRHAKPRTKKDLQSVCRDLRIEGVFSEKLSTRKHASISLKCCLFESSNAEAIENWIINNIIPSLI